MATKDSMKNTNGKLKEEFVSSFDVDASVPDPVTTGDAHAERPADLAGESDVRPTNYAEDNVSTDANPLPARTVMLSQVFNTLFRMPEAELSGMYGELQKLGGIGADSHALRPADVNTGADQTAANYANGTAEDQENLAANASAVAEDLKSLLSGTELSEKTIKEAVTLFQAAVTNRSLMVASNLEEEYSKVFQEALDEFCTDLEEQNNKYMDAVAEKWLKENEVAIESGIRVKLAESFIAGLKELFEQHYVDIPESKIDVEAELMAQNDRLQEELDAANDLVIQMKESLAEVEDKTKQINESLELEAVAQDETRASILAELSEGLSVPQMERLAVLAEELDCTDIEAFRRTAARLIPLLTEIKAAPKLGIVEQLETPVVLTEEKEVAPVDNPLIQAAMNQISRMKPAA